MSAGMDMDDDEDLDRRLVGWMTTGPSAAPPEVVERALVETTTVVQLPRETGAGGPSSALRSIVIGTLLALIVLTVAVGLAVLLLNR